MGKIFDIVNFEKSDEENRLVLTKKRNRSVLKGFSYKTIFFLPLYLRGNSGNLDASAGILILSHFFLKINPVRIFSVYNYFLNRVWPRIMIKMQ